MNIINHIKELFKLVHHNKAMPFLLIFTLQLSIRNSDLKNKLDEWIFTEKNLIEVIHILESILLNLLVILFTACIFSFGLYYLLLNIYFNKNFSEADSNKYLCLYIFGLECSDLITIDICIIYFLIVLSSIHIPSTSILDYVITELSWYHYVLLVLSLSPSLIDYLYEKHMSKKE